MKSIVKRTLDTVRPYKGAAIYAVSGDSGSRFINAIISVDGIPIPASISEGVTVTYRRADGSSKTFDGAANADGSVTVPITQWAIESDGYVDGWITVTETNGESLTTTAFMLDAQIRPNVGGEVSEDDPEYDDYAVILARLASHDASLQSIEKLAESTADIASRNSKQIENFGAALNPSLIVTDDSVAYSRIVPANALPYAEIEKVGGMTYRDKASGTLTNAMVTGIKSIGANLIEYPYYESNLTRHGVRFEDQGDGGIKVSGTPTDNAYFQLDKFRNITFDGKVYFSLQGSFENIVAMVRLRDKDKTEIAQLVVNPDLLVDMSKYPTATQFMAEIKRQLNNKPCSGVVYPMLNIGSELLPYEKYKVNALEIPKAVQSIEGYDEGIDGNICNHIQWVDGKTVFNRMVKSYTVAGDSVINIPSNYNYANVTFYRFPKPTDALDYGQYSLNYLSAVENSITADYDNENNIGTITGKAEKNYYWFCFAKGTTLEQAQSALDGFKIVYQLATTEVTDITDLITNDNFIEVHEGGVVTSENADGLAVPTTITYQIKEVMA